MNIYGWFFVGLTGFISLYSKGLSRVFSSTIVQKHGVGSKEEAWINSKEEGSIRVTVKQNMPDILEHKVAMLML